MAAESAVSFVLNTVSNLLSEEVSLLVGVKDEVEWLRDQLRWMESFLKDAYTKRRRGDERAKQWERAVREAAYQVEDIIESYVIEINSRRQQPLRCCGILMPVERYARELKFRHKLGADIKQLKVKIQQISVNRAAYGLVDLGQSAPDSTMDPDLQKQRRISPRYGDSVVVGFQEHKQKILDEILDTNLTQLCVKSIVGMGGLGKTTLAKMVFNADDINSFGIQAWVSVSQDYTLIQLLKDLTKQITSSEFDGVDESALKERIYKFLQGKRYFIVFDDIWETGILCHLIEAILPNGSNSSRVLLTTRFMDVARFGDSSIEPYQLPCLNENEGLELFLKKAFRTTHDTIPECPRGLYEIARRLVNKCGGLPLAIVVLGGLMSNKKMTPKAWLEEEERMDWESTQVGQQCLKILALSYDDITNPNMRSCFLYMGVFPEDSLIEASQLIALWVAEGFIPQWPNRTMEDTAANYLDQLVQRSMIEVVKRDWDGSIVTCRIHDLLRDLCLKEAREDGFLHVFRDSTDLSSMGLEHNRVRLAFHHVDKVEGCCPGPDLRSLLIFGMFGGSEINREMFQGRTKLRVIHLGSLSQSESESLLAEAKATNHLRYLASTESWSMGPSRQFRLPQSFGYIHPNLQTLDVRGSQFMRLPESLGNMKTLRHLYLPHRCKLPPNIANLTNLQTIDAADGSGGWIEQSLAMLSSIRRLSIDFLSDTQQKDFANALRELKLLSSLEISMPQVSAEYIRALSINNRLFNLRLKGPMLQGQLPEIHDFPQNLIVLELDSTELEKDPMPTLELLPNLASLHLWKDSYSGKELVCTAGGFLRLENLELTWLDKLERWDLEDGAMPNLASLSLLGCNKLRLPEGLPNLKKLQKVEMSGSPDFVSRLQEGVGEDWSKIKHLKSIKVNHE